MTTPPPPPGGDSRPGAVRLDGGAFDVVADVHGCLAELDRLLERLGYARRPGGSGWTAPRGRRLVLAGDLVDRGPDTPGVLRAAMATIEAGDAVAVVGNHDDKLLRWLSGRPVKVSHGLEASVRQLEPEPASFRTRIREFLAGLPSHAILGGGRLVVAHAGLPERLHGSASAAARDVAMYGMTRPGRDAWGFPLRIDWAAEYAGAARIVYGHTPVLEPIWRNGTIDIDTGCVFGNRLTAVRYPELEVVSVPAQRTYQAKGSPFRVGGPGGEPVHPERYDAARAAG